MLMSAATRGGPEAEEALDVLEYATLKYFWMMLLYFLLCAYALAIITNWGVVLAYKGAWIYQADRGAFVIKLVNAILSSLVYLWVLVAPVVLKNRKFGYPEGTFENEKLSKVAPATTEVPAPLPKPPSSDQ